MGLRPALRPAMTRELRSAERCAPYTRWDAPARTATATAAVQRRSDRSDAADGCGCVSSVSSLCTALEGDLAGESREVVCGLYMDFEWAEIFFQSMSISPTEPFARSLSRTCALVLRLSSAAFPPRPWPLVRHPSSAASGLWIGLRAAAESSERLRPWPCETDSRATESPRDLDRYICPPDFCSRVYKCTYSTLAIMSFYSISCTVGSGNAPTIVA